MMFGSKLALIRNVQKVNLSSLKLNANTVAPMGPVFISMPNAIT